MFRSIIRIRIAAGILVALMVSVQAYGQDKNFLWRVQSKTKSGFILGSIHLMKEEHYPLSRMIENAFKHSQSLAVEVNINEMDPGTLQRLAAEAFYPPGDSLEKHLSPSAVTLVRKQTEAMGMEFEFVKRQKPWFLATTLPAVALLKAGYDPRYGVDMHFLKEAKGQKKILELESLDSQMKMFSGFPESLQELLLLYTLNDLDTAVQEADSLIEAWRSGNTKGLEAIATRALKEDHRMDMVAEKLLYQRNKSMADRIEQILRSEDDCFIVLGAAHLVGEKSVLQFLNEKGFKVSQL